MFGRRNDFPQTDLLAAGTIYHLIDSSSTNTASRIIDDTLESLLIIRISHQTEISNDILDFLALIETQSTINPVRDTLFTEFFLKTTTLRIRTVKDSKITILTIIHALESLDILADDQCLLLIAIGRLVQKLFSLCIFTVHILRNLITIVLNQTVCGIDNSLGRAVVLFQLEKFGIIEMASEIQDIINISTTETIDTL